MGLYRWVPMSEQLTVRGWSINLSSSQLLVVSSCYILCHVYYIVDTYNRLSIIYCLLIYCSYGSSMIYLSLHCLVLFLGHGPYYIAICGLVVYLIVLGIRVLVNWTARDEALHLMIASLGAFVFTVYMVYDIQVSSIETALISTLCLSLSRF